METMRIKTKYGDVENVYFRVNHYANNNNLAVHIMCIDEEGVHEPYTSLTTNIIKLGDNMACIDTNNLYSDVVSRLENKGMIKNTGNTVPSGYCVYPVYEFTDKFFNSDYVV